jgi:hypothetical protein
MIDGVKATLLAAFDTLDDIGISLCKLQLRQEEKAEVPGRQNLTCGWVWRLRLSRQKGEPYLRRSWESLRVKSLRNT